MEYDIREYFSSYSESSFPIFQVVVFIRIESSLVK